jgi:hypothetical protein
MLPIRLSSVKDANRDSGSIEFLNADDLLSILTAQHPGLKNILSWLVRLEATPGSVLALFISISDAATDTAHLNVEQQNKNPNCERKSLSESSVAVPKIQ